MPIISFWNNEKEETGKTLSLVAIATYMSIMHNFKVLIIDTEFNSNTVKECFWENNNDNLLSQINSQRTDVSTGVEGLAKAVMSNKSSPEIITNYTKIVFKDRLEVLLPPKTNNLSEYQKIASVYKDIIKFASKTYDVVFVNVSSGLYIETHSRDILLNSDFIVINLAQKIQMIEHFRIFKEKHPDLARQDKYVINLGKYDMYSKYNTRNLARELGERKELLAVPYCTQFFEAACEGKVADYFIKFNKILDVTDKNAIFMMEVKKTSERIIYKLQELQMRL